MKLILRTKTLPLFQELVEFQIILEQNVLLKKVEHKAYDFVRIDENGELEQQTARNKSLEADIMALGAQYDPRAASNVLSSHLGSSPTLKRALMD